MALPLVKIANDTISPSEAIKSWAFFYNSVSNIISIYPHIHEPRSLLALDSTFALFACETRTRS